MKKNGDNFLTEIFYNICYFKNDENNNNGEKIKNYYENDKIKQRFKSESKSIQTCDFKNNYNIKNNKVYNYSIKDITRTLIYLFLIFFILFVIWGFIGDLKSKYVQEVNKTLLEIKICEKEYFENRCDSPVPALEIFCLKQKKCLNLNPKYLKLNIKIWSNLIAELLNNLFQKLNYKSLIIVGIFVIAYKLIIKNKYIN